MPYDNLNTIKAHFYTQACYTFIASVNFIKSSCKVLTIYIVFLLNWLYYKFVMSNLDPNKCLAVIDPKSISEEKEFGPKCNLIFACKINIHIFSHVQVSFLHM